MIQGTTPTFTLTLPETIDLSEAEHVIFTIEQLGHAVSKNENEMTINAHEVAISLGQEDTLYFDDAFEAMIQLNWTYEDGTRAATKVKTIKVDKNLYKGVIE